MPLPAGAAVMQLSRWSSQGASECSVLGRQEHCWFLVKESAGISPAGATMCQGHLVHGFSSCPCPGRVDEILGECAWWLHSELPTAHGNHLAPGTPFPPCAHTDKKLGKVLPRRKQPTVCMSLPETARPRVRSQGNR